MRLLPAYTTPNIRLFIIEEWRSNSLKKYWAYECIDKHNTLWNTIKEEGRRTLDNFRVHADREITCTKGPVKIAYRRYQI